MKKLYFYFFTAFALVGCGEELGSISTGGVSLGGTGLPTSGGSTPPLETDQDNMEYIIWTKGLYSQICENLTVSAYFIDSDTQEAILNPNQGTFVKKTNETTPTNLTIKVTVENNSLYPIYEYKNSCDAPVQLKDQDQNIYEPATDSNACVNTTDEYQILLPSQTTTYNLKYSIPQTVQNWDLSYNKRYSINQYSPIDQRKQCSNFSLDFSVVQF